MVVHSDLNIVMSLQNFWLKCIGFCLTHDSRCIAYKHSSLVMHSTQCSPRASHSGLHWVECITCDSCIVYNASLVIRHLSCIIQYIFAKNSAIAQCNAQWKSQIPTHKKPSFFGFANFLREKSTIQFF